MSAVSVYCCVYTRVDGQSTAFQNQFAPLTVQLPGNKLRLLGLAANVFTLCVVLAARFHNFGGKFLEVELLAQRENARILFLGLAN